MRSIFHILLSISLFSCTLELELEEPDTVRRLAMYSIAQANTDSLGLELWEDASLFDRVSDIHVRDATITIYELSQFEQNDRQVFQFFEIYNPSDDRDDFYFARIPFAFTPGLTYNITAERPGYPTVTAVQEIPRQPLQFGAQATCRKCYCEYLENKEPVTVEISINDEPGRNYYHLILNYSILKYDFVPTLTATRIRVLGEYFESNSPVFEDHIVNGRNRPLVFTDELFDGQSQTIAFTVMDGPSVSPFEGIYCDNELPLGAQIEIELRNVSEAYYNYYNTVTLQDQALENPFAEPVQVFNNIEGGRGLFGAYSSVRRTIAVSNGE